MSTADAAIVLTPDGGAARTIRTDGDTRVRGSGNDGLGDLRAGERVVVRVTGTGDAATAVAILAPQARVTGTVTALTGTTAAITGIAGLTVTADVSALSRQPAVGDLVVLTRRHHRRRHPDRRRHPHPAPGVSRFRLCVWPPGT